MYRNWKSLAGSALIVGLVFAGGGPALAVDEQTTSGDTIERLLELNPGVSESELMAATEGYASSVGISLDEALQVSLNDAEGALVGGEAVASTFGKGVTGSSSILLGPANNKGDIFVSPASTGPVNHGHTGIFFSKTTIVEAPGGNAVSQTGSTSNYRVGKGAVKQSVTTTTAKRNASANHAYNKLLNKKYNFNFAFNKDVNGKEMNCSQLVWAAYKVGAGIDLDSNGGPGVYPYNIKDSKHTKTYKTL